MNSPVEYLSDGTLVLDKPVQLPKILDMLIVGGGPAGTAAAFRAKELGLSALVIDFDDLLKRLRDYAKDKFLLPDFGGGDKMQFPKGGDLISLLAFSPMDKDDMCALWKGYYREHNIPARVGIELERLELQQDATWQAKTWNHNLKAGQTFLARHVVIAIGRGVPRRFDVPGDTDGIAYRLDDAAAYVGEPACVIGGGTSAAEAVVKISEAKRKAGDPTPVHWSYRGEKVPRVARALSDGLFEAYARDANIHFLPNSEPVAVITGDDRKDYLSIRTERKEVADRPMESIHLEFLRDFCIACIGEDIPETFLNSMGIFLATDGRTNKKRMVVTSLLETQQSNVYMIGDMLSQAYLETDNFSGDASTFREIRHRGNIKASLIDGVYVAEAIAQKVAGKKDISVELQMQEEVARQAEEPSKAVVLALPAPIESEGPPEESFLPARVVDEHPAYIVRMLTGSVEEDEFPINKNGITTIGRKGCNITFSDDLTLSEKHASIIHGPDGYFLRDDGSPNGVFYRIPEGRPIEMSPGSLVRLGRQFLLFFFENERFGFVQYDQHGKQVHRQFLQERTILLGREAPAITLDSNDGTLSRRHVSVAVKEKKVFIKDLKSLNGTYLKVKTTVKLEHGDQFRAGQQIFKLVLKEELVSHKVHAAASKPMIIPARPSPAKLPTRTPEEMVVTFANLGKRCVFEAGQTICDIAEKNGMKLVTECFAGICGSDPVRILSGKENLNDMSDDEKETLEEICGLASGEYRLACMVKPTGPVEVEIPQS
jgi:thioredoxin reductase/pSer/pThr/pTyr-binding forkhead associated (FHA) protein/ferredoxin